MICICDPVCPVLGAEGAEQILKMCSCGEFGSAGLTADLDDLRGLFQPK